MVLRLSTQIIPYEGSTCIGNRNTHLLVLSTCNQYIYIYGTWSNSLILYSSALKSTLLLALISISFREFPIEWPFRRYEYEINTEPVRYYDHNLVEVVLWDCCEVIFGG